MTREERLSLAIARHFENPDEWFTEEQSWGEVIIDRKRSPKGYWFIQADYSDGDKLKLWPRSITESEIAMKLLKWLIENDYRLYPTFGWEEEARYLMKFRILDFDGDYFVGDESLELAIAEAFAKANNLEVE